MNYFEFKFHDEVIKLLDDNKSTNNIIFTRERYNETIHSVKEAKSVTKKTQFQRYLTKKYDVLEIAGIETDRTVIYDKIVRARKRALSGQQIQAEEMMSSSKRRLVDLKVNDNIIIPVPRVGRGPIDCRNIRGIIVDKTVIGYKIGTTVGVISGLLSRNQIEKIHGHELTILDVHDNTEISVRKAVQLLSLYGGQGHIHCSCRSGCKTGKCKCKRKNILCNSRCNASLSCANK